ncbi:MAG: MBL fold metallo-hydrolase [Candidatus Helarchaeota archaeon]
MQILFLGTSGSSITPTQTTAAILIDDDLLMDVGEGTTQKLLQHADLSKIRTILISHLHVDHFIGLFSLLWKKWLINDHTPLTIYGPPKIESTITQIFTLTSTPVEAFQFKIEYRPLDPNGSIIKDGNITATQVIHPVYTLAYRIDRNKSICYSSDTAPLQRLVKLAQGCELLIHDCSFPTTLSKIAHRFSHSTPRDAAEIAQRAGVKILVLFHIHGELAHQADQILQEANDYFDGEVILAQDLKKIEI